MRRREKASAAPGPAMPLPGMIPEATGRGRGRTAAVLATIAAVGAVIAAYLTYVKLTGGVPTCGPFAGCETVQSSEYSTVLGIPVSVFGLAYSLTVLALTLAWWRTGDRGGVLKPLEK